MVQVNRMTDQNINMLDAIAKRFSHEKERGKFIAHSIHIFIVLAGLYYLVYDNGHRRYCSNNFVHARNWLFSSAICVLPITDNCLQGTFGRRF